MFPPSQHKSPPNPVDRRIERLERPRSCCTSYSLWPGSDRDLYLQFTARSNLSDLYTAATCFSHHLQFEQDLEGWPLSCPYSVSPTWRIHSQIAHVHGLQASCWLAATNHSISSHGPLHSMEGPRMSIPKDRKWMLPLS